MTDQTENTSLVAVWFDFFNEPTPLGSLIAFHHGRVLCRREFPQPHNYYINTRPGGVLEIHLVKTTEAFFNPDLVNDSTEVSLNASNIWDSVILTGKKIGIIRPTSLGTFLRPYGLGGHRDRVMRAWNKDYIWEFQGARNGRYVLTENRTDKRVCVLEPRYNEVIGRVDNAVLAFYDWNEHQMLLPACILSAVIFFNLYRTLDF